MTWSLQTVFLFLSLQTSFALAERELRNCSESLMMSSLDSVWILAFLGSFSAINILTGAVDNERGLVKMEIVSVWFEYGSSCNYCLLGLLPNEVDSTILRNFLHLLTKLFIKDRNNIILRLKCQI